MAKNNEVAVSKFEQFIAFANERAEMDAQVDSAEELAVKQVEKLVDSETVDDLFAAMATQGLTGLRDLESGTEIEIRGYRIVKSSNPELSGRTGAFAIIDAIDLDTRSEIALDTSIERILAFLLRCDQMSAFPVQVKVMKKQTMGGNTLITFAKPAQRAR